MICITVFSLIATFPLMLICCMCCVFIVQKEVLKALKKTLLAELSECVLGTLTEDSGAQLTETLSSLIKHSANMKDTRDLINNLPNALQKGDSFERFDLTLDT